MCVINWCWFWCLKLGQAFWSCTLLTGPVDGGGCALSQQPLSCPSPVPSVNEVEDPGGMVGTFWLEERLSVCDCVEVDLLHPHRKWLWWGCGNVLVLTRLDFRWLVKIYGLLEEQLLWVCPGPVIYILNSEFSMYITGYSCLYMWLRSSLSRCIFQNFPGRDAPSSDVLLHGPSVKQSSPPPLFWIHPWLTLFKVTQTVHLPFYLHPKVPDRHYA